MNTDIGERKKEKKNNVKQRMFLLNLFSFKQKAFSTFAPQLSSDSARTFKRCNIPGNSSNV